jgi:hypothetical protein
VFLSWSINRRDLFFYFSPVTFPAFPAILYRRYLTSAANSAKLIASIN